MLILDNGGFKVGSIKWDKRNLFYIDKSYDNENIVVMNFYTLNNIIFKNIKVKLVCKYEMKNR